VLNLKNFKKTTPSSLLKKQFGDAANNIIFLESSDGHDWYSSIHLFQPDTIKIAYDDEGIIRSLVNKPDSEGNYDASLLVPINLSVAEILVENFPDGVDVKGSWKFDGTTVYQDGDTVTARVLAENTRLRTQYAATAALNIATLQAGIASDRSVDGDSDALTEWQKYLCDLRDMTQEQLQQSPVDFPLQPKPVI
jgi:hypothetical protein